MMTTSTAAETATDRHTVVGAAPLEQGRQVNNPVLDVLVLENRRALERAVQQSKLLPPGLGLEHVSPGRSGAFVVSCQPDPEADPVHQDRVELPAAKQGLGSADR